MYKCPRCGEVGEHQRTVYGHAGDGRNLERYCSECGKKFIADRSKFRSDNLPEKILELVEERLEDAKEKKLEVSKCDIEECDYDMDEQEHIEEELMMVGRKQALREIKSNIELEIEKQS